MSKNQYPKPLSLAEIEAKQSEIWNKIHAKEQEANVHKITSEEAEAYRNEQIEEMRKLRIDVSKLIYRTTIGHYGGYFIDVPEENFEQFKALFPPQEFPRAVNIKTVDVRSEDRAVEGEAAYRRQLPNSNRYKQIFFANGTKGEKRIDISFDLPHDKETNPAD